MFAKQYEVDEKHIDFQGVVDGLYYPFYMEWTRHAYMREALGIDIEEEFKQGKITRPHRIAVRGEPVFPSAC